MRVGARPLVLLLSLASAACAAPDRIGLWRSPLLEVPEVPLTPEGNASPLPLEPRAVARADAPEVDGEALARTARGFLGERAVSVRGRAYPDDCTGLVRAVYAAHGIDLLADGGRSGDTGVAAIWRYAGRHGSLHDDRPRPGDIVFYRETYDRNRDGRDNDGLTHVGIVEAVDPDRTVSVIHRVARGVMRYHMNLEHPRERSDAASGRVLNDYLRAGRRSRFAAELFAGYATLAR